MNTERVPLLKTKLHIPPRRPNVVIRPRLMTRMGEALQLKRRLTLISARAGSGKTTLVSEWLHHQDRPSAWLSLDANDNDPERFINYLLEALRQLPLKIKSTEGRQPEFRDLSSAEALMAQLINDAAAKSIPFLLVLDDYHVIQNDWIHRAVSFLLDYQPENMHLILTTRVDPPLPLAQLRARGQLTEIRDRDLLFTTDEVVQLLNGSMALDLPARAVTTIAQRTEGWIAGLQMAALSARAHKELGDLEVFIDAFGGTNRYILDYLTEEVLRQQPPLVQDFLIETSILERMCGELCDAVRSQASGAFDSQSILVQLERTNMFVIPLDDERRWYRYHHLFADLLQSMLRQRRSAEQIRELHRRAGQWYLDQELPGEAMTHILAAGDFERAADVIDEKIAGLIHMVSHSQSPLILNWIDKLPEQVRRSHPSLDVYRANMMALSLQLDEVDAILDDVEKRIDAGSPRASEILGHAAAVRAYCANLRGDAAQTLSMAARARDYLSGEGNSVAQSMLAYTLADTYFALDDMQHAQQALLELIRFGEKTGQIIIIVPGLCDLAAVHKVQGRLHEAQELYERARRWLVEQDSWESRSRCSYEFGMADLLREQNQLEAAYEHAMAGIEIRRRLGAYQVIGDLALMRVLQAQGDMEGAHRALHAAERSMQVHPFQLALTIEFRTARVLHWLAAGNLELASRYAADCCGGSEQEQIMLARLRLAQGRADEAQEILSRQRPLAEAGGRRGRLIEILALQALTLEAGGRPDEAEQALSQAVSLAWPEEYMRIFLDLGQPLRRLLERLVKARRDYDGYVRALLSTFPPEQEAKSVSKMISPLSGRELEVLQLLAEGLSNKEIAERLVVTPGTIKQHLKNISRKLEVHGRMQAVRRARELKLL
jgi:LuxR family maltose regulon positive regulatory protein